MQHNIKIWIVEDEALISQNLRFMLEDLGYEILGQSFNFEHAAQAIAQEPFELLMLDINLGAGQENGGFELAALLRQQKDVPFLFLSAYSDIETIKKAVGLRPSAYLVKPSNAAMLFAAIQTAIENHQTQQTASAPNSAAEQPAFFFSKIGNKLHKVFWKNVASLEAIKNYVSIKTFDQSTEYLIRGSLIHVSQQLMPSNLLEQFKRINRGVLLHQDAIKVIGSDSIETIWGTEINCPEEHIKGLERL